MSTEPLAPSEDLSPSEALFPSDGLGADDCAWPIDMGCANFDGFDPEVVERARMLATAALRSLTAYRVGGCPRTVRPCSPRHFLDVSTAYMPSLLGGQWMDNGCGCAITCGCSALSQVVLPAPAGDIHEVKVDGQTLSPSAYLLDGNRLLRTDGSVWPTRQRLDRPDTEPGTFSITYLPGYKVDRLGALAAGLLTYEFARACSGSQCRLPSGVTQIARQGITMEVGTEAFPNGRTGIREVDVFIERWNPHGLRTAPRVLSPETRRYR